MNQLIHTLFIFILVFAIPAHSQVPEPVGEQQKPIVLKGGTIHTGTGQVIENGFIMFDKGKITDVGTLNNIPDVSNYEIIDTKGQQLYPGLILPTSTIGLEDISAVRATRDYKEVGTFNPNVRSLVAYNTDSEMIPTFRFNGILLAQTMPMGGIISGSSSVMMLEGWNWEDAVYKEDVGIHLHWPKEKKSPRIFLNETQPSENKKYSKTVEKIKKFIQESKAYNETSTPEIINLRFEAMKGVFSGEQILFIHANEYHEIQEAIYLLKSFDIEQIVLVGGRDAHYTHEILKQNKIPVLLTDVHQLPRRPAEDVDLSFKLPAMLSEKGILVGLTYGWLMASRNLAFYAGTAATYGLNKEEALQLVTLNPAKILGIDDQTGSLEVGKDANIVVSKGDLLDMRTNNVSSAFIKGKKIILDGKQQMLYERFKNKYQVNKN